MLVIAAYPEVFLGSHSFFDRDFGLFTYPIADYTRESVWQGEIPLWNPYNNCGLPLAAQWNTTVFYPLSWVYILFPLPWSLNYFCLGHLLLAGTAMYSLAFHWSRHRLAASVAGLAYALNGLSFNSLMWTSNLAALAWLPLVILVTERAWREGGRRVFLAGACGAMQMLSGSPEIILLTWLALTSLWLVQALKKTVPAAHSILRLGAVGLLTFLLASVQLLPFLELLHNADRSSDQASGMWSMPAWGWANFLVPLFRLTPTILGSYVMADQQWTSSYYVGIGVAALALAAITKLRNEKLTWLGCLAAAGMILALGENGFLYTLLKGLFPWIGLARYPVKFVVLAVFALPLLAAFAVAGLQRPSECNLLRRRIWHSGLFLLISLTVIVCLSRAFPYAGESSGATARSALERAGFLLLTGGAILWLHRAESCRRQKLIAFLALILIGLDSVTHMPAQNPTVPIRAYGRVPVDFSPTPRLGESRAMLHPRLDALLHNASTPRPLDYAVGIRRLLFCDCNLPERVPKVNGFFSLYLGRETELRQQLYSSTNLPTGLLNFLSVTQLSSPDTLFEWAPRQGALPWVTAGQRPVAAQSAEALTAILSADFDPTRTLYITPEAGEEIYATNETTVKLELARFSAHNLEMKTSASEPSWLVVSQAHYPCWRAYVDGKKTRLWRANYAFQAVQVPAGEHRVTLRYEDHAFQAGLGVSVVTLAFCLIGWLSPGVRRKRVVPSA